MSTLFVNGTLHSTADPYATAMLVDSGSVAWVGAEDTAASMRARSGADWQVVDLDGALVVPAFVDSLVLPPDPTHHPAHDAGPLAQADTAGSAGVFLSVIGGTAAGASGASGTRAIHYRAVAPDEAIGTADDLAALVSADSVAGLSAVVGPGGLDAAAVTRLTASATAAGVQLYLLPQDPDALAAVISALRSTAEAQGTPALGMVRHRLSWNGPVEQDAIQTLAENSLSFTAVPDADGTLTAPIASLLSNAVPVSFGSGTRAPDPWSAIRASLEHADPDQRISARSGFTAATKAGLRALPMSIGAGFTMAGRIAPSSPATFGIWAADALSVQAPDGRVAAWSTDTRAGTPLLPVLEEGTAAPECLATLVDGTEVYRSPAWT
ncbi:amidohydrolase family protein [Citricoccus parietis]|uniref:Amidohydrolase family protein n=1 Tax=Citricoccus parietis TaxID=592307 RepID=A0ABV6F4Q9_9MICC